MPIDTDNGQLALLSFGTTWAPNLPFGDSDIDQGVQQQFLWGFPELLWEDDVIPDPGEPNDFLVGQSNYLLRVTATSGHFTRVVAESNYLLRISAET